MFFGPRGADTGGAIASLLYNLQYLFMDAVRRGQPQKTGIGYNLLHTVYPDPIFTDLYSFDKQSPGKVADIFRKLIFGYLR